MSADELFEELGYELTIIRLPRLIYHTKNSDVDSKNKNDRFIEFNNYTMKIDLYRGDGSGLDISFQELKAINKKVEELGWNV